MKTWKSFVLAFVVLSLPFVLSSAGEESQSATEAQDAPKANRPLVTLTGTDSRVKEPGYHLVKSEKEWVKIWQRHKGVKESEYYDHFYNPLGLPEVNFDKCMVIAAFQGAGWNSAGLKTTALNDEKDCIVFRFMDKGYQTAGPDGGGKRVTVYGFFVLPRSDKTVVVEENVQNYRGQPPVWKERIRLPK